MEHFEDTLEFAQQLDKNDPLAQYREKFFIPKMENGKECIYLCGNSLGLQPKTVRQAIGQELDDWAKYGVEGHFHAKNSWVSYHELLAEPTARLVGAKPSEVVTMNSLTVNLHILMVSFYRPTPERHKILIEANAFPSDQYAVKSQIAYHGYNIDDSLIEVGSHNGDAAIHDEDIFSIIEREGDSIALILLGGVNYLTGQVFDMRKITELGHKKGCVVGFDLAHGAGNIVLKLHDWDVDFAVWCTYKYLNSGPGSIASAFVHQRHESSKLPRFAGWWGHDKKSRFKMGPNFQVLDGAEGWQLSNPPIFQLAALRASMAIFDEVGMPTLRNKSVLLTEYLFFLIDKCLNDNVEIITPREPERRGCQLSIRVTYNGRELFHSLLKQGVICDWREPDVVRVATVPLYNSFTDVFRFVEVFKRVIS